MKALLRSVQAWLRPQEVAPITPGTASRPIANVHSFLEDLRARGFSPRGILDVGANAGHWSRMARSVFPSVPMVLIEPQDEMEGALNAMCREWANVHYVKAGAGPKKEVRVQTIWPDLAGSSFLPEAKAEYLQNGRQRRTPMVTIDDLLRDSFPDFHPDLVKLDIQGFELEALAGAGTLFGRTEVFISETSLFKFFPGLPIAREVIVFMAERGYEIYDVTEHLRRPHDGALGQLDLAFAKANGVFRRSQAW